MKEFALKHPILTFLLADSAICGILNLVNALCGRKKEVKADEPAGDIQ